VIALPAGAAAIRLSDGLAAAHTPVAAISGGEVAAMWLEGDARYREDAHLRFRSLGDGKSPPPPSLAPAFPAFGAFGPRLAAAPGGFVAGWVEGSALRIARFEGGRGVWATPPVEIDAQAAQPIRALGVAGGVLHAVTGRGDGAHALVVLRWTLDGARLDDLRLDAPLLLDAAVGEEGIAALVHEEGKTPQRCVRRFALDGTPAPKACVPAGSPDRLDGLLWAEGALFHATVASDDWKVRLRRFRCAD
jgi:hypothetical protein